MASPEAVKVIVRCRPMNGREKDLKCKVSTQCGNFVIFLLFKFYVKSILKNGKVSKIDNLL